MTLDFGGLRGGSAKFVSGRWEALEKCVGKLDCSVSYLHMEVKNTSVCQSLEDQSYAVFLSRHLTNDVRL